MKRLKILTLGILLSNSIFACSCLVFYPFCQSYKSYDLTAAAIIRDSIPYGITLEILHQFRGNETRDTIQVFDFGGPYNSCNDTAESKASFFGNSGDTIIIALPQIDTLKNSWDIIGAYRTPSFRCHVYKLEVKNDSVKGFIYSPLGYPPCSQNVCVYAYAYPGFINNFSMYSQDCDLWLSDNPVVENKNFDVYPNPGTSSINIETNKLGKLSIINNLGQLINQLELTDYQTRISVNDYPEGIYFLSIENQNDIFSKKIIIQ